MRTTRYYKDDHVTLWCGDCCEVLDGQPAVDHVITDPPYDQQTHDGARSSALGVGRQIAGLIQIGFDPADPTQIGAFILAHTRRWCVVFCSLEMLGDYRRAVGSAWVRAGFWRRPDGAPQFTGDRPAQPGEGLAIFHGLDKKRWHGGGKHAYYEVGVMRGPGRVHPTQKPEPLMAAIIADFTDIGETVLDPFAGSGTTLVAAKRNGRKAIGVEIDEGWCEMAARRVEQTPVQDQLNFGGAA